MTVCLIGNFKYFHDKQSYLQIYKWITFLMSWLKQNDLKTILEKQIFSGQIVTFHCRWLLAYIYKSFHANRLLESQYITLALDPKHCAIDLICLCRLPLPKNVKINLVSYINSMVSIFSN